MSITIQEDNNTEITVVGVTNHEGKEMKATAIYREGCDIKAGSKSSDPKYNDIVKTGAEFIADSFPHIVGCKLTADYTLFEREVGADITYVHSSTSARISVCIQPVEKNKVSVTILRGVDWGAATGLAPSKSYRVNLIDQDHVATITLDEHGPTFLSVLKVIGETLSESIRVSKPATLCVAADTSTPIEKVDSVRELDKIAKSLGNRLHEIYGHKIDTKK